jgi:hypothetical protein
VSLALAGLAVSLALAGLAVSLALAGLAGVPGFVMKTRLRAV